MACPATPTATVAFCPQCGGSGVERAVGQQGVEPGDPDDHLRPVQGRRPSARRSPFTLRIPDAGHPAAPELALWPFWVPVVFFLVFFLYLYL